MTEALYLPPPKDGLQRVRRFARDLAWGAINNLWGARLSIFRGEINEPQTEYAPYKSTVWHDEVPSIAILESFGFITLGQNYCQLTEKAFLLLDEPPPTAIFISYRRPVSSALALLIWADLRAEGFKPFIDIRSIAPGDEWHALLEKRVKSCNVFISVIGHGTFDSEFVRREVHWALETPGVRMIPVLHTGFKPDDLAGSAFPELQHKNVVVIQDETALEFYDALEQLKHVFGLIG